jgi:chemotaxis-related protein WspD
MVKLSEAQNDDPQVAELQLAGPAGELAAQVHDCWSTIGVSGNGTCRELQGFVHCRNCPVYSAAGIQLLDRPLPADYRRERTGHYADAKKLTQPTNTSLVVFRVGQEWLALPTSAFQEIAERRHIHTLPHRRRSVVVGLVNVRGELLICVSVARLLGLPGDEWRVTSAEQSPTPSHVTRHALLATRHARLLVANWDGQRVAFPVDEVFGIHRFHLDEMKEPPATISKSTLAYTQGVFAWRERSVGFLDADLLFRALNPALAKSG